MKKLEPKVNIERHTLEIAELEARVRELENLKKGYQDELGWINEKLEQAEARVKELEEILSRYKDTKDGYARV